MDNKEQLKIKWLIELLVFKNNLTKKFNQLSELFEWDTYAPEWIDEVILQTLWLEMKTDEQLEEMSLEFNENYDSIIDLTYHLFYYTENISNMEIIIWIKQLIEKYNLSLNT